MDLVAFPTRVMLMAEYGGMLPLWDRSPSPDLWIGPFDRGVLGLPAELETRLVRWNERFENLLGPTQEWPSAEEHLAFVTDGHLLAADVQRAFGAAVLVLYLEADSELSRAVRAEPENAGGWAAVSQTGAAFSPAGPRARTIVQQMWDMPEAAFAALTRTVDLAALLWQPGRMPTRILLRPQEEALPLLDRSALAGRPSDRLDPAVLGLSGDLVDRLHDWNDRWRTAAHRHPAGPGAPWPLDYLVEGHLLAADVQRELGPRLPVLFPEADAARSRPSVEMAQFIERLRARGTPSGG
ncbi:hypothetical protein [Cryobacterium sp. W22_MBD10_FK3]|uniref:hypothetical protein n=1 Tax=Cryobacterium sp. W22_MBD10_FK3 TaxID=3240273 RepID=UPI003F907258